MTPILILLVCLSIQSFGVFLKLCQIQKMLAKPESIQRLPVPSPDLDDKIDAFFLTQSARRNRLTPHMLRGYETK